VKCQQPWKADCVVRWKHISTSLVTSCISCAPRQSLLSSGSCHCHVDCWHWFTCIDCHVDAVSPVVIVMLTLVYLYWFRWSHLTQVWC